MIPFCYHPTRVILVNGSIDLTNTISHNLPKTPMTFHSFENSENAIHYMNEVYRPEPFYERYQGNTNKGHRGIVVDTHLEIYRPERFEEISTVVYDHTTPRLAGDYDEMTLLEFVCKIENPHIQKILIIEEWEEDFAADILNKGLIQFYICKNTSDWAHNLHETLQEAQWSYFNKLSEVFMKSIKPGVVKEYALDDPNFQKFFRAIISNHGFTEAYICESTGSYLFLDSQAQDHGLVVNMPEQLDEWATSGKIKGVNLSLLKALRDRKKMMCYHANFEGVQPDTQHWDIYAHPANAFKGERNIYYYAFAPNIYDIDIERVLPFKDYRENQQRKVANVH